MTLLGVKVKAVEVPLVVPLPPENENVGPAVPLKVPVPELNTTRAAVPPNEELTNLSSTLVRVLGADAENALKIRELVFGVADVWLPVMLKLTCAVSWNKATAWAGEAVETAATPTAAVRSRR